MTYPSRTHLSRTLAALGLSLCLTLLLGCKKAEQSLEFRAGTPFRLEETLGRAAPCGEPRVCSADYLSLPERIQFGGEPRQKAKLEAALDSIDAGKVNQASVDLSPRDLEALIRSRTGATPLLERLESSQRTVRVTERWEAGDQRGYRLLIEDPLVGTWEAILLLPRGRGPFPALVASHGHANSADSFLREQHGSRYPAGGYALLVHDQRVSYADEHEDKVARKLLSAGGSLMAVRSYEVLVGLELLRALPVIDPARIALIGHSGGTLANLLTVRLTDRFAAHVADGIAEYRSWDNGLIADETLPALYPHSTQLSRVEGGPIPAIRLEYGYPAGPEQVWDFLASAMPK